MTPTRGPMARTCPQCSAAPGDRCRTAAGRAATTHAARWPATRHGATQPEADRLRAQVLLRLDADARTALEALAARWGCTRSGAVERLALGAVQHHDTASHTRCVRCGDPADDHVVDDEERRECRLCECTRYEAP